MEAERREGKRGSEIRREIRLLGVRLGREGRRETREGGEIDKGGWGDGR